MKQEWCHVAPRMMRGRRDLKIRGSVRRDRDGAQPLMRSIVQGWERPLSALQRAIGDGRHAHSFAPGTFEPTAVKEALSVTDDNQAQAPPPRTSDEPGQGTQRAWC